MCFDKVLNKFRFGRTWKASGMKAVTPPYIVEYSSDGGAYFHLLI